MSLSFEESLKINSENNVAVLKKTNTVATMNIDKIENGIMTLEEEYGVAAYAGDDGSWIEDNHYVRYSVFDDNNISIINDKKDIQLDGNQFNITQEENSQYIPFEMPRYYDGYDLTKTSISIHYETETGKHGSSKPVNVTYNNNKIRFGWLVDANATVDVGNLKFEIHAYGSVIGSDGKHVGYVWKTKSNSTLNILQSLCDCEEVIDDINDSWIQELATSVAEKVADQIVEIKFDDYVKISDLEANYHDITETYDKYTIDDILSEKSQVQIIENDLSGFLSTLKIYKLTQEEYDKEVENGTVEKNALYLTPKDNYDYATIEYVNGEIDEINDKFGVLVNDNGVGLTVEEYVKQKIDTVDVSDQLKNYALSENVYTKEEIDTIIKNLLDTLQKSL